MVSRALVFSVLSGLLLIAYAVLVAVVGELSAGERRIAVAAAALAALAAAAGWERAQRAVDRLLYGERRDPFAVATRLGTTLDAAAAPAEALQALADEIARALRLPRRRDRAGRPPGARGDHGRRAVPGGAGRRAAADPLGEDVGRLRVTHRHPGERWQRSERAALDDAARRAATLVWAAGLVADLQAGRERIVAGREEERRRLRHDLHDGVGPELAGMALQLERLAGKLGADPDLAALAGRLRDQMRARWPPSAGPSTTCGRRPSTSSAWSRRSASTSPPTGCRCPPADPGGDAGGVAVVAEPLPPLRAAVEVAAYRIAAEAVANAVRHAEGSTCRVSLGRVRRRSARGDRRRRPRAARRRRPRRGVGQHARAGGRARRHPRRDDDAAAAGRPSAPGCRWARDERRPGAGGRRPPRRTATAWPTPWATRTTSAVVGTAADGESAVALVGELRPDVVLMDLRMPGGGGLAATTAIAARHPQTAVLVLTMSDDDDSVFAALRAGARGYLLKESEGADIARAVRAAARSEAVFGPRIADRVLAFFASSRARSTAVPFPELTDREREVLDLVAARPAELRDRDPAVPQREDGAQPGLRRADQAARGQPGRGGGAGPRRRAGPGARRTSRARPQPPGAAGAARTAPPAGRQAPAARRPGAARRRRGAAARRAGRRPARRRPWRRRRPRAQPCATPVATSSPVTRTVQTSSACPPRRATPPRPSRPSPAASSRTGTATSSTRAASSPEATATTTAAAPATSAPVPSPRARALSAAPTAPERAPRSSTAPRTSEEQAEWRRAAAGRRRRPRATEVTATAIIARPRASHWGHARRASSGVAMPWGPAVRMPVAPFATGPVSPTGRRALGRHRTACPVTRWIAGHRVVEGARHECTGNGPVGEGAANRAGNSDALENLARIGLIAYGVVHLLVAWLAIQLAWFGGGREVGRPVRRDVDGAGLPGRQAPAVADRHRPDRAGRVAGRRGAALAQRLVGLGQDPHEGDPQVGELAGQGGDLHRAGGARHQVRDRRRPVQLPEAAGHHGQRPRLAGRPVPRRRRRADPHRLGRLARPQGPEEDASSSRSTPPRPRRRRCGWSPGSGRSASPGKGVALALVGGLLVYAAVTFDPSKAQGPGRRAAHRARTARSGKILLTLVALGIAAFGAFLFVRARYPERPTPGGSGAFGPPAT